MSVEATNRMSVADYLKEVGVVPDCAPTAASKRSKWRNVPTWYESPMVGLRRYASKKEAIRARELDRWVTAGKVIAWWHQWPIYCGFDDDKGTPVRMYPDFRIMWADGSITLEDTKGAAPTYDWRLKRNAVRELHGIEVKIVR